MATTNGQFHSIEPLRLYDSIFLSTLMGVSIGSIRKVSAGFRDSPLIPRLTRLGAGTVRFAGRDIVAFLDDPVGQSEQSRVHLQPQAGLNPAQPLRRRAGRPRTRDAAENPKSQAKSMTGRPRTRDAALLMRSEAEVSKGRG